VTDTVVLDASAALALIRGEPGAAEVEQLDGAPYMSAVNAMEVLIVLGRAGLTLSRARSVLDALHLHVVPVVPGLVERAADVHAKTRRRGLSLADAVCLATASALGAVVYTADKAWGRLDLGIDIRLIR
jgi:PIN domain nuclease of toxin-antitoxin system